jgi:general secretion pathway protein E
VSETGIVADREETPGSEGLGALLLARGKATAAGLERAERLAETSGEPLHAVLTKLGLVTERDMAEALAEHLGLPLAAPEDYPDEALFEGEVSQKFLKDSRVVPLADGPDGLVLAMADPLDAFAISAMELNTGRDVRPWVGLPADIEAAVDRVHGGGGIGEIIDDIGEGTDEGAEDDVDRLRDLASEAPVIRLVNLLIAKAVESRASDIHIEPFENRLRVRYRTDGVLRDAEAPPNRLRAAVISRIKLMAKLNIAERRLPQDGRIKLAVRGKEIDLRVSTIPTMHGESVVLRVLDRDSVVLDFAALGFQDANLEPFLGALERPDGILLVTGPTGSGKTTTLYTSLIRLNTPERKILTVEDPIEYHLEGVNQIQVKPQIDLSFANVLRSILRQDPDIVMIGEIRDLETARIAVQAALTGHLVLSTLHTNNAAGTITRLLDMGVEDYLLTSTINGIAAQRLVRTICADCREPYEALPELVDQLQLARYTEAPSITLYRGVGCAKCHGTGYLGRTTIIEILVMDDAIRRLVLQKAEAGEIQRVAAAAGMRTMYEDGIRKAMAGITSIEEILRVTRDV